MRDLMASLIRLVRLRLRQDERGVIGVLVAVLIGGGVLTGMGALVVDIGQLYQERAELQNGADAAALGVAKSCALGTCNTAIAGQLADLNASSLTGGTAGYSVCGSGGLGACQPSTGQLTSCPPPPPAGINFVEVNTSTLTSGGSTLLPPAFATSLLGNSSYQGSTVLACAQAEWGSPVAATTDALTISACEWDQATQQGSNFAPAPPYPPDPLPAQSADEVLLPATGSAPTGCGTEPVGADGPNTFGWADDQGGHCTLPVSGSSFPTAAGPASPSGACKQALQDAQQSRTPILVPVYVSLNAGVYTLQGFADFVVTGYDLPGFVASDWLDPANSSCLGAASCVNGYFVQGVIPVTGNITGTNLGVSVIDLTG